MADIAILVAEEYERRLKISRRSGQDVEFLSCVGALGKSFKGYSSSLLRESYQNLAKILVVQEPRSPMSVAATHGFFSA